MLLCAFSSCAAQPAQQPSSDAAEQDEPLSQPAPEPSVSLTLYAQPYFAKAENGQSFAQELVAAFTAVHPEISITLHELAADQAAEQTLSEAVKAGQVDLLFDSPDTAIYYARRGALADLSPLYTEEVKASLAQGVIDACSEGQMQYLYPIGVSPYLMAFNKEMLEAAGLLALLPYERSETRAWTVEEYTVLLTALKGKLPEGVSTGMLYAKSSSGDAATRALLQNLYGASFISNDRSEYTFGGDAGKKAFAWLNKTVQDGLLAVDGEKTSADVVKDFVGGKTAHTILYSVGLANNYATGKKDSFTEIFMPYPTQQGKDFTLEYSLYGLSVFDHGDSAKVAAAQTFINFVATDRQYSRMAAVMTGGISPDFRINELRYDKEYNYVESLKANLGSYVPAAEGYDLMKTYWFDAVADAAQKDAKTDTILEAFVKDAAQTLKDAQTEREAEQKTTASEGDSASSK